MPVGTVMYGPSPLHLNMGIENKKECVCYTLLKSNPNKQIGESGKSGEHQGGYRIPRGRVPSTEFSSTDFARTWQRRNREVNLW